MGKSIQFKDIDEEKCYVHPYYPVGSIYLSVNNTNPTKWFDGTWELIAKGRTLVGVDESDTDFNTVKKTGGSKYLQAHSHDFIRYGRTDRQILVDTGNSGKWGASIGSTASYSAEPASASIGSTGTGNSGNLQPYFTCYIWCRTA